MADRAKLYAALRYYYGYESFRAGQEEIISDILAGRPVLAVLPTGSGKSICFQLPGLLLPGLTMVVSPLVSLMKDQAEALRARGIAAAYLDASMGGSAYGKVLYEALHGQCKFLYVAPERLANRQFLSFAQKAGISLVAVDEAHCVSQWGHDFRRDYYQIPAFIRQLPVKPRVAAFTATATPAVRRDILSGLRITDAKTVLTGFDRPNLYFAVQHALQKERALFTFLAGHKKDCGIIYCATRATVEQVSRLLSNSGYAALRYHAGLTPGERRASQNSFLRGTAQIIVATNAFGMGIDKADVRYVVHFNMPGNLESYYQEAGRAGRDGRRAECLLLYAREDVALQNALLRRKRQEGYAAMHDRQLLAAMVGYCHASGCLRRYLLRYFGAEPRGDCHNCSNCANSARRRERRRQSAGWIYCLQDLFKKFHFVL